MLFGVLYTVFSVLLNFSGDERFYPVALLLGIVMFSFLNEATGGAVRSLVNRENLVRKIEFPRLAVPMATVLTACFNLGLNLVPVTIFLHRLRRRSALDVARDAAHLRRADRLGGRHRDAALGALRALPRHRADLERRAAGHLLRHADLLHRVARAREGQRGGRAAHDAQPVRGHAPAGALRVHRPLAPEPGRGDGRRRVDRCCRCLVTIATCVAGYVVFSRAAPRVAEEL